MNLENMAEEELLLVREPLFDPLFDPESISAESPVLDTATTKQKKSAPAPSKLAATEEQIRECKTHRKLHALETFYKRLNELNQFDFENGHKHVPQQYEKNRKLGAWVNKMRTKRKQKVLETWKIEALDAVHFEWGKRKGDPLFEERFRQLCQYKERFGTCDVQTKPKDPRYKTLGRWVSKMRSEKKKYENGSRSLLDSEKIVRLDEVKFQWVAPAWYPRRSVLATSRQKGIDTIAQNTLRRSTRLVKATTKLDRGEMAHV